MYTAENTDCPITKKQVNALFCAYLTIPPPTGLKSFLSQFQPTHVFTTSQGPFFVNQYKYDLNFVFSK
jgi:hypothetical protein